MAQDLTGNSIKSVYSSFLHLSSGNLTSQLEKVFDGVGNEAPIMISTGGVALSGNVSISNVQYPKIAGNAYDVISVGGDGNLIFSSISNTLTASGYTKSTSGTFSNPRLTIANGLIQDVKDNPSIKTFFLRVGTFTNTAGINAIQSNWPFPSVNDIANVMNMTDLKVYVYKYTSNGWENQQVI